MNINCPKCNHVGNPLFSLLKDSPLFFLFLWNHRKMSEKACIVSLSKEYLVPECIETCDLNQSRCWFNGLFTKWKTIFLLFPKYQRNN
ncbi:hypothetical protein H5410_030320 [Solanum commersonii]|uniref:Uncharacterized protein n=1 Tax=Solanum commersonii TaxID=4109 RepID=A0A9J5YIZ7_SOLCO|nr:hypothetical protein H5410_030320 [Solanum commersonii]